MRIIALVFSMLMFLSASAQEKEVIVPAPVARYFLEVHDKYMILLKKDSLNETIIENFTYTVRAKDLKIESLTDMNSVLKRISEVKDEQIELSEIEVEILKKQLRRQKVKTVLISAGQAIIIILLII